MKVCYWNVCNASQPEDIMRGCEKLIDQDIGILCLQEVPYTQPGNQPLTNRIKQALALEGDFVHTRSLPSIRQLKGYGTTILSNVGIRHLRSTQLQTPSLKSKADPYPKGHIRSVLQVTVEERPEI